jgi:hypothetical protein
VPLTKGQIAALETLAAARNPESYVAGSTPLNRSHARISSDIDIFHDLEDRVAITAEQDAATMKAAGFAIEWVRRTPGVQTLVADRDGESARLEWVADSDFRFFPTVPDAQFGYMLHPVDLALNKASAAAGRRALRDIVDLVVVHETILPLGAIIWAAVEKAPGFTPEAMIAEIRRNAQHPAEEWRRLASATPIDSSATLSKLRAALDEAEAFAVAMPTDKLGLLFIDGGKVVQPDPARLDQYAAHSGQRRGHWPSSPEIAAAMMAAYAGDEER